MEQMADAPPDSICQTQTLRSPESPSHVPDTSEIAADSRLRTSGDVSAEMLMERASRGGSRSELTQEPACTSWPPPYSQIPGAPS